MSTSTEELFSLSRSTKLIEDEERILSTEEEDLVNLLGRDVSESQCATILEVSAGYVSQLKARPHVAKAINTLKADKAISDQLRDERLDSLEDGLLDNLEKTINWFAKPRDILDAIKTIHGLERRGRKSQTPTADSSNAKTVVQITLPNMLMVNSTLDVKFNSNNEIVRIEGQDLLTMQTENVLEELEQMKEETGAIEAAGRLNKITENTQDEDIGNIENTENIGDENVKE